MSSPDGVLLARRPRRTEACNLGTIRQPRHSPPATVQNKTRETPRTPWLGRTRWNTESDHHRRLQQIATAGREYTTMADSDLRRAVEWDRATKRRLEKIHAVQPMNPDLTVHAPSLPEIRPEVAIVPPSTQAQPGSQNIRASFVNMKTHSGVGYAMCNRTQTSLCGRHVTEMSIILDKHRAAQKIRFE